MLTWILGTACIVLLACLLSSWGHAAALRHECLYAYKRLYFRCEELSRLRRSIVAEKQSYASPPWEVEKRLASSYASEMLQEAEAAKKGGAYSW